PLRPSCPPRQTPRLLHCRTIPQREAACNHPRAAGARTTPTSTAAQWTVALAGVAVKLVAPRISDAFWSAVYIGFGWLAVLALKPMIDTVHPIALGLLVLGGLIYTAGVFVFISPRVKFRRAIWHGFVVGGATVHWAAVLVGVVLAPAAMG
ncbi:MAG: hemolysin III family protein, partial [Brevundimonas sp.]|nr:hemolysin III family protein [Brevundimonas sp.]